MDHIKIPIFNSKNLILNISDEVMNTEEAAHLDMNQKSMIQELFSQGVKHKMRMNFVRQMSKTSGEKNHYFNETVSPCILKTNFSFLKPDLVFFQVFRPEENACNILT